MQKGLAGKQRREQGKKAMNRIRDLREDRGLRQIDVAQETGIDQRTLSNYETGKTNPDSYAIIKLAEFYGVTCDFLLGVTDVNAVSNKGVTEEIRAIRAHLDRLEKHFK